MLKIKDNTTKQKISGMNIGFWDYTLIRIALNITRSIRNETIYISDDVVNYYNKEKPSVIPKSNASFVRKVKELNKQNFFDDIAEKVGDK